MRAMPAASIAGPTSFRTRREIGEPGSAARAMPIRPPIDVPTQCTVVASRRASSVTMSAT